MFPAVALTQCHCFFLFLFPWSILRATYGPSRAGYLIFRPVFHCVLSSCPSFFPSYSFFSHLAFLQVFPVCSKVRHFVCLQCVFWVFCIDFSYLGRVSISLPSPANLLPPLSFFPAPPPLSGLAKAAVLHSSITLLTHSSLRSFFPSPCSSCPVSLSLKIMVRGNSVCSLMFICPCAVLFFFNVSQHHNVRGVFMCCCRFDTLYSLRICFVVSYEGVPIWILPTFLQFLLHFFLFFTVPCVDAFSLPPHL